MSVLIRYGWTCPHDGCEGRVVGELGLDLTADSGDDGVIHIDVDMALSQETFSCEQCGCLFYTGDWEDFALVDPDSVCMPELNAPEDDDESGDS